MLILGGEPAVPIPAASNSLHYCLWIFTRFLLQTRRCPFFIHTIYVSADPSSPGCEPKSSRRGWRCLTQWWYSFSASGYSLTYWAHTPVSAPERLSLMKLHLTFSKTIQKIGLSQENTITDDSVLLGEPQGTISKPRDLRRCFKISCRPGIEGEDYWLLWHLLRHNTLAKHVNSRRLPFSYWILSILLTISYWIPSIIRQRHKSRVWISS